MPGDVENLQALNPTIKPPRRQNKSCDPCRRSKRRCVAASASPDGISSTACENCRRLGHQCTFEFAERQLSALTKRKRRQCDDDGQPSRQTGCGMERPVAGNTGSSNSQFDPTVTIDQDILSTWLNLNFDDALDGDTISFPAYPNSSPESCLEPSPVSDRSSDNELTLYPTGFPKIEPHRSFQPTPMIGLSFNSPIYLLNSAIDAKILGDRLTRIYEAIATPSASRFLDYDCNNYPSKVRYRIAGVASDSSIGLDSALSSAESYASQLSLTSSSSSQNEVGQEISLLGSVRFLDHFGDLYGNRLRPAAKKKTDEALKAVLRAFSMQWLPSVSETFEPSHGIGMTEGESSLNSFVDAWAQARSLLLESQNIRSFRMILAILTFVGIVTPTRVIETEGLVRNNLLDTALDQLCYLDQLVKRYFANLGPSSIYGSLADASLSIIRWAGYIRDTGAALSMDHRSKLSDHWGPAMSEYDPSNLQLSENANKNIGIDPPKKEIMAGWATCRNILELDANIQPLFRKASADTFYIWRRIIHVKESVTQPCVTIIERSRLILEALDVGMAAIDEFDERYQSFFANCIANFKHLSTCPRISIGMLISITMSLILDDDPRLLTADVLVSHTMFWSLGIFLLADVYQGATKHLKEEFEQHNSPIIRKYQAQAVSLVARVVECVHDLPAEELFNLQNGLSADVPITAYHVTPSLAVTALEKAIESVISLQSHQQIIMPDGIWDRQIDFLMKGLLSLNVTIGGSQTCEVALRQLMSKHGDILSECWTSGFET
ncbi:unnamed protein product [Penicillium salamii]|uniref:Zn(2)-C6 fungal-type domain-containing protein n=1 Tax=Penicillium salamii TaxID=1612424 RepID=A0A9W4J2K6_9EURO|nr:unnamed protein product [Penicillium salamii]CAG8376254.1 unnamed protein product [Penicillium salamii]CAG8378550.1 unnamed protein product [Penicillium salamii]CAG8412028.1 unnamed protein product [Penicillium salamii]